GRVDAGSDLGRRDPQYSLAALLGDGGPASVWLGGGDVWAELAAEYRRIARDAAARGDHRRAAYIYGVLLRDLRLAADTLAAGGGATPTRLRPTGRRCGGCWTKRPTGSPRRPRRPTPAGSTPPSSGRPPGRCRRTCKASCATVPGWPWPSTSAPTPRRTCRS